ncbi:histidine kinase [uncultured Thiocystis sp.]|jgi:two-component system nitrate/nitrite sensor histidine kinase NarX|uniref:histidine kinase n=1 Tax=uncultured Thiocystis sp. TaxID=1202134 RepID=UPI0025F96816|nr:histidine kinase [uncultured Thiocystis sp.]
MTPNTTRSDSHPPLDASRVHAILRATQLAIPLLTVAIALTAALILLATQWIWPELVWRPWLLLAAFLLTGTLGLTVAWMRLRRQLLIPLARLEHSLSRVCQGEQGASEALRETGVLGRIAQDIRSLNEELTDLYEDMDNRVARQTMRLAQKTASLKILYDVAAGIQQTESVEELLLRFLRVLKEMINGRAATVRLVMADGSRRLIGSIGLNDDLVREQDMAPVDLCLCGTALTPGDIVCDKDARYCSRIYGRRMFKSSEIEVVTVPLEHRDELLGVYSIFVDRPGVTAREDIMDLLFTVGHHLGVAIAKQRSDAETRRLSIVEERNSLAHELHDSLAQTLASLRFQCRMLNDSLGDTPISEAARNDLARIRNGLDEAHTELRELLASFRAPLDRRGLVPALAKLTNRLGRETGAHVLFQNDCRPFELSASDELQLLRIAQESLANIRKHARAHTIRVLLTREPDGRHVLLIEDDGVGFSTPSDGARPGECIGLSILEERARRIGAELSIESDPGEGTRVEVIFEVNRRAARPVLEPVRCAS